MGSIRLQIAARYCRGTRESGGEEKSQFEGTPSVAGVVHEIAFHQSGRLRRHRKAQADRSGFGALMVSTLIGFTDTRNILA
jgi:hypothetical protein